MLREYFEDRNHQSCNHIRSKKDKLPPFTIPIETIEKDVMVMKKIAAENKSIFSYM